LIWTERGNKTLGEQIQRTLYTTDFTAQVFITVGIILLKKDLDPLIYPIGPEKLLMSVSDFELDLKA
jgi:hypothetical protein